MKFFHFPSCSIFCDLCYFFVITTRILVYFLFLFSLTVLFLFGVMRMLSSVFLQGLVQFYTYLVSLSCHFFVLAVSTITILHLELVEKSLCNIGYILAVVLKQSMYSLLVIMTRSSWHFSELQFSQSVLSYMRWKPVKEGTNTEVKFLSPVWYCR